MRKEISILIILLTMVGCSITILNHSDSNAIPIKEGLRNTPTTNLDTKLNSIIGDIHDLQVNTDSIEDVIINKDSIK